MAQRIGYYSSYLTGNGYFYVQPDYSAEHWQVQAGTSVSIAANSDGTPEQYDNGFYGMTSGQYVRQQDCGTLTAVYETVTDACVAPTGVTVDTAAKVLTITGGAGGDLNAFTGYLVQYRQKAMTAGAAWGAWTDYAALTGGAKTRAIDAPAGYARQFRACTTGAAGAAYYSGYVASDTILYGNAAPGAPTITHPGASAVAATATPTVVASCPAEPDGGAQTLQRSVDGGAWGNVQAVAAAGGTVYDTLPTLSSGSHTVQYRLTDAHGLSGGTASVTFTVTVPTWARTIAAGTVISNAQVSHRADIAELRSAVNAVRAYYGLTAIALPGTVGAFADWKEQMEALQAGLTAAHQAAGKAAPAWPSVPGYPAAAIVNGLRAGLV